MKTKGMIEAEISNTVVKCEKDYTGRGPTEVKTYIVEDMVIVRLKGILTKAEEVLIKDRDGADLIKKVRYTLIESVSSLLYQAIKEITGVDVLSFHTDISTDTCERIIIFSMAEDIERRMNFKNSFDKGL